MPAHGTVALGLKVLEGGGTRRGVKAVYASADSATAILEVAVHKTFKGLDTVPLMLTGARILDTSLIHIVDAASLPNPNWLVLDIPSGSQQQFGDDLLSNHPFVLIQSSVSRYSWNILVNPVLAKGLYEVVVHEPLALDSSGFWELAKSSSVMGCIALVMVSPVWSDSVFHGRGHKKSYTLVPDIPVYE